MLPATPRGGVDIGQREGERIEDCRVKFWLICVLIDDGEAMRTRLKGDIGLGHGAPPRVDLIEVIGRVFETVRAGWLFCAGQAWKDLPALRGVINCGAVKLRFLVGLA